MWSNYFMRQDDDGRMGVPTGGGTWTGAGGGGGRSKSRARPSHMSNSQRSKIKLLFFVAIVGVTLTVLGLGTEFWVELAEPKHFHNNQSCQVAYYGLWKACTRKLWVSDIDPERESCGPAELPGDTNCTYFKFYTSGENAVIFKKTTSKNWSLASAMLGLFSFFLMVMGSVCVTMTLTKNVLSLLKPAFVCFFISGILILLSIAVFHQSVLVFLASDHSIPLHYELSWSVACAGSAGAILLVGGFLFLLVSFHTNPLKNCIKHQSSNS